MTKDELMELADRCEREEASGDLDGDIARKMGWRQNRNIADLWMAPEHARLFSAPPPYTTSLDAAVTLVPEGHGWQGGDSYAAYGSRKWARVFPFADMSRGTGNREAATVALALCAAALRARAS